MSLATGKKWNKVRGKSLTGDVGISRFGPRGRAHCWRSTLHLSFRPFIFLLWPYIPSSLLIFRRANWPITDCFRAATSSYWFFFAVKAAFIKFSKPVAGWVFFVFSKRGPPFVFPPLCHCSSVNVPLISMFQGHVHPFLLNWLFLHFS